MRSHPWRSLVLTLTTALLLGGTVHAESAVSAAKLGKKIDNVSFKGADGKTIGLHDLKDKKAIVVVFLSFDCPVSNSYAQPLTDMAKTYGPRGVAFIGVCPCDDEPAQIIKHVKDFAIPFPVFKDDKLAAADALKADVTPEAFILDDQFVLRYRGRIDNAYSARLKKNQQINKHDLKQALDELLAGKPISEPVTQAVGCTIQRDRVAPAASGQVTYHRDVLPILQNRCQTCHRPGEVGPFALMTYKQAVTWASDIKDYTQSRKMPPWKPIEGAAFQNERKLTDKEIATVAAWVDGGTPEGNAKEAPPPRKFVEGWQLGKPDLVLTSEGEFQLGPNGRDVMRCFVLPTDLPEDKYVTAVEVRPGNPRIVHHALLFVDTAGQARQMDKREKDRPKKDTELDIGPGYSSAMGVGFLPRGGMGGWAPGQVPRYLPENTGFFLPKGADVIAQVHYHRNGRLEKDRTQIGLYLAPKPLEKRFQGMVIPGMFLVIPAGADNFKVNGSIKVEQDCVLHNVMPHMHMVGKSIKVTMTPPDGPKQTLVAIKEWDYNWQETYVLKESIPLKAGTRLDVEAIYDNSAKNPNNPNSPPKMVTFGEQTNNEMCFVFLGATSDTPGRIRFTPFGSRLAPPKPQD